jgi:hypothetical protein
MWIVSGAWFGAHPAGVSVVNVATVSVAVVPVFEMFVRRGGVIQMFAGRPRLWIRRLLIAPATATTTTVPVVLIQSTPIVGSATLMLSHVVGWG